MDISKASAGYSVDNINPAVPTGLSIVQVSNGLELSWNVIEDLDFQYYKIERSTNESFESHEVFYTVENYYTDINVENNQSYFYRIASVDYNGNSSNYTEMVSINALGIDQNIIPTDYKLYQNYPNPFNPVTTISYDIIKDGYVELSIYNSSGKLVNELVDGYETSGRKLITWNGTDQNKNLLPSGYTFTQLKQAYLHPQEK